jgi:hypothetical protein
MCRQFDPTKVQSDLVSLDGEVTRLALQTNATEKSQVDAQNVLNPLVATENQLGCKRAQVTRHLAMYCTEIDALLPIGLLEAVFENEVIPEACSAIRTFGPNAPARRSRLGRTWQSPGSEQGAGKHYAIPAFPS